jgi:signal transduction histidine kinase
VDGPPSLQLLIYQVAREALMNAVRHSGARNISIRLLKDESEARLIVGDDGTGFAKNGVDREYHFGLQLMKERVEQAEGVMHIESRLGEGTQVLVRFPLQQT